MSAPLRVVRGSDSDNAVQIRQHVGRPWPGGAPGGAARSRPVPDQSGARSAHQLVPCAVYLLPWSARSGLRRVARAPGVAWRAVAGGPLHPPRRAGPGVPGTPTRTPG